MLPLMILRCTGLLLAMVLGSFKLEKLTELIVLALINNFVTINLTELVVVAEDFNFVGNYTFISIVVPLNN